MYDSVCKISLLDECIDVLETVDSVVQVVECVTYVVEQISMAAVTLDDKKPARRIGAARTGNQISLYPVQQEAFRKNWTSLIPNIRRSQFKKAFIRHKRITVCRKIGEIFDHLNRHGDGSGTLTRAGITNPHPPYGRNEEIAGCFSSPALNFAAKIFFVCNLPYI